MSKPGVKPTASSSNTNQKIYEFLKERPIGVLSTADKHGNPRGTVIYYGIDRHFECTFMTKRDTGKHEDFNHNNRVMLTVYEASSQTTVQITGEAVEITGYTGAQEVFDHALKTAYQTSESDIPPFSKLAAGHYIAYRIKPRRIRMATFVRKDPGDADMFETIEFED